MDIVVPCFNEEDVLPMTYPALSRTLADLIETGRVSSGSRIVLVDDGSSDKTWQIIDTLTKRHDDLVGVRLARNSGHQNALLAGVECSEADAILTVDADLQDDIKVIPEMVGRLRDGYDIVYGVRKQRKSDTVFKRRTARVYYQILRVMGVNIIEDHADFRLLSRAAVNRLLEFSEVNLFLRGMVPLLGARAACVYYERLPRSAGETKYPLRRMLALAIDGVTSFSAVPLRLIAALGLFVFVLSVGMTLWTLFIRLFTDDAIPGWASSVIPVYFLGGIQLLSIGVVGEYIAKIYMESKHRPRYFIEMIVDGRNDNISNVNDVIERTSRATIS